MIYPNNEPISEKDALLMNPLQLAYIGDAVWSLLVRNQLIRQGYNVRHMHSQSIRHVNAHAQAVYIQTLYPFLLPSETELVKRGRNAHIHHPVPKNQNPEDYALATGFEALIGFLHLTGNDERIRLLARNILEEDDHG